MFTLRNSNLAFRNVQSILLSFSEACKDIEDDYFQMNKPCNRIAEYYIELNGILPKDIILDYCQTDLAKGVFAKREGNTVSSTVKLEMSDIKSRNIDFRYSRDNHHQPCMVRKLLMFNVWQPIISPPF